MSWTEKFFGKYYLQTHLPVLNEEKTYREVNFLDNVLGLNKGDSILDVPCGHGRHSILLAKMGYKVTGVDNQKDFIQLAKDSSKSVDNVDFSVQDMREINFENSFDAVINLFTSFGYFSEEENEAFLKSMAKAVKPGGKLIIETVNREWAVHNTGTLTQSWLVYPPDNITFLANNSFDIFKGRMLSEQAIIENGERYTQDQDIRLYSYTEMNTMLKSNGMKIINCFGNFAKEEYSSDSSNMIIIAQKASG